MSARGLSVRPCVRDLGVTVSARDLGLGLTVGALAGAALSWAICRARYRRVLGDLDHDLRRPLTVIRGEAELVLGEDDVEPCERRRSQRTVIEQVLLAERLLRGEGD